MWSSWDFADGIKVNNHLTLHRKKTLDYLDGANVITQALKIRRGRQKETSERFEAQEELDLPWQQAASKAKTSLWLTASKRGIPSPVTTRDWVWPSTGRSRKQTPPRAST